MSTSFQVNRRFPRMNQFFVEEFSGTLVSDSWGAYNAVACALRQTCLVHLLRDLQQVEKYKSPSKHWAGFAKKLRRHQADLFTFLFWPPLQNWWVDFAYGAISCFPEEPCGGRGGKFFDGEKQVQVPFLYWRRTEKRNSC